MKKLVLSFMILISLPVLAFAQGTGLGGVAQNMMDPVTVVSDFIHSGCIVIGGAFLFASFVKYLDHRRSPLMVPISTVIFLFVAGLVLVLLPLVSYLTTNGIPYSLLK